MIINESGRLKMSIANCRAEKFKATAPHIFRYRVRFRRCHRKFLHRLAMIHDWEITMKE